MYDRDFIIILSFYRGTGGTRGSRPRAARRPPRGERVSINVSVGPTPTRNSSAASLSAAPSVVPHVHRHVVPRLSCRLDDSRLLLPLSPCGTRASFAAYNGLYKRI